MNKSIRNRAVSGTALALAVSAVLTACGGGDGASSDTKAAKGTPSARPATEVKDPLVATFDGGLYILDGESLELGRTIELPGFNRVNPAGDEDRKVLVIVKAGITHAAPVQID